MIVQNGRHVACRTMVVFTIHYEVLGSVTLLSLLNVNQKRQKNIQNFENYIHRLLVQHKRTFTSYIKHTSSCINKAIN